MTAPLPRLEFRWRLTPKDDNEKDNAAQSFNPESVQFCDYGLVLPLKPTDIRIENNSNIPQNELFYCFSTTMVSGGSKNNGAPFRDGVHAKWDGQALNITDVWCRNLDGTHQQIA